jgi:hypothetical protein
VSSVNEPYKAGGDYSSFAAPVVAGVASVLIQKAKSDPNLQIAASVFCRQLRFKINSYDKRCETSSWQKGTDDSSDDSEYPLDFKQGAGMVDALSAYNLLIAGLQHDGDVNAAGWDI